jgi:alpha-tubulin suppressor-like RCC1 family protein
VLCWGGNELGEVGDGTGARRGGPSRPVTAVRWLSDAAAVTAGYMRTCALRATGAALCWGNGAVGALGADQPASDFPNPVAVTGLRDAVSLASASLHSCAGRAQGGVVCWGVNHSGQLGDAVTRHAGCPWPRPFVEDCSAVPVPVELPCDVEELGLGGPCGGLHSCARQRSGAVLCWGRNAEGQLGDGTRDPRWAPVPVVGLTDAMELAVGGFHTCARRATGAVVCWGRNDEGQLGDGTLVGRVTMVAVAGLDDATEIAAGELHTCARRRGGGTVCWGNNQAGQLGDGHLLHRACSIHGDCNPTPVAVVGLP